MKKLIVLLFLLITVQVAHATNFITHGDLIRGTIDSSNILLSTETAGDTFAVKINQYAQSFDYSACTVARPCYVTIFSSACSNITDCSAREVVSISAESCTGTSPNIICTLTIATGGRDSEYTSPYPHSGDWVAGSKVEQVIGTWVFDDIESAINDRVVAPASNTANYVAQWHGTYQKQLQDGVPIDATGACASGSVCGGGHTHTDIDAVTVEGYGIGTFTNGYLCRADTAATPDEIDCDLQATNANTASTVVQRDGSGNFSAGTITAALTGNSSTATALAGTSGTDGSGDCASGYVCTGGHTHSQYGTIYGYIQLLSPAFVDGTGAVFQTDTTQPYFAQAKMSATAATTGNYAEYKFIVPTDIDTSADLILQKFKFRMDSTETNGNTQIYKISMGSVADSEQDVKAKSNEVTMTWTAPDGNYVSGDVATLSDTTLTSWKSSLTAGQMMTIRLARDGATDTSSIASYTYPMLIRYTRQ